MKYKRTFIIAEAGVNHNGSMDLARKLIECAVESGADAVKFQTFRAESLASLSSPKADYQLMTTDSGESQFEMLKKLELSEENHFTLVEHCKQRGIMFLSSTFGTEGLRFLTNKLSLSLLKIPSGEITNSPLLLEVAQSGRPVILSTGMSTLAEIETALGVLAFGYIRPQKARPGPNAFQRAFSSARGQSVLKKNVVLLHCTTEYPAPFSDINLKAMDKMRQAFGLPVGLSDHSAGSTIPVAAVARGAVVIEKHFTLDRNLPGPDHKASLEPDEFKDVVKRIRQVEEAVGSGSKVPASSEWKNRIIVRKSLVAACAIKKGEKFTSENITAKRPGDGISPVNFWDYLGRRAERPYQKDELIK